MRVYQDRLPAPSYLDDKAVDQFVDELRAYGEADRVGSQDEADGQRYITVKFEAEDDWDLRDLVGEAELAIGSMGWMDFIIDKAKVSDA